MFVFAGVGLAMRRTGFPVVCLVIGFLLGGMLETSLRQSMLLYKSDFWVVLESPIALGFLLLTLAAALHPQRHSAGKPGIFVCWTRTRACRCAYPT